MPRAIWSGSISFGLVNVPVKVYSAIREHKVRFHQVDKKTGSRIRYEKVAEKTGQEVDSEQIELGYEVEKGKLVTLDPSELDELRPETTRMIEIADFVELGDVDPAYYDRTYWLLPDGEAAARAYRLLVEAMEDRGRVGIGNVVMRNKAYLAAIRPRDGALALSTMHFADEVLPLSSVAEAPSGQGSKPEDRELKLATQIVDSLSTDWKPDRYKDTYSEEVAKLIQAHAEGEDIVVTETAPDKGHEVVDLMAALEASLAAASPRPGKKASSTAGSSSARTSSGGKGSTKRSRPKKATASKTKSA
jgi:DNA end-binding protein Ku